MTPIIMESYQGDSVRHPALLEAVTELQNKRVLEEVSDPYSPGFYGRLFLRPKPDGSYRSIIDLSGLNDYVENDSFQMESSQSIQEALRPDLWVTSIDLKDAYYHIPIHPAYRKYFRVALFGKVLQFRALPMGLNVSARIFTKIMLEVAKMLRKRGVHIHQYIDDWLLKQLIRWLLRNQTQFAVKLCVKLGLQINYPKSQLEPLQEEIFVGVEYQFKRGLALAPCDRLDKLEKAINLMLARGRVTARFWASVIGQMGSVMKQIRLGPLHRRPIQLFLQQHWDQQAQVWDQSVQLNNRVRAALSWWLNRDNTRQGVSLRPFQPRVSLFTDASQEGYGATLESRELSGLWTKEESALHSNNREMLAVIRAIQYFKQYLRNQTLLICSDNTTTVSTINKQGGGPGPGA